MYHSSDSNRSWEALLRAASYRAGQPAGLNRHQDNGPTIAISREVGARGTSVAHAVGSRLGWNVYDHELLERMAREMDVEVELLKNLDEHHTHWLQECLESLNPRRRVNEISYSTQLVKTLYALAASGECVIVGRGAAQVLPEPTTLCVRLVAAWEDRVRVMSEELGVSPEEAARVIQRLERDRTRFVKEHFHHDPTELLQYDFVLNTSRFSVEECAAIIVQAVTCWRERSEQGKRATLSA